MSQEFVALQDCIKSNKCELKLKRSLGGDEFVLWLQLKGDISPSVWNLFGYAGSIYLILTMELIWIIVALFIAYKFGWLLFFLIFIPFFLIKLLMKEVGKGFLLADAQDEERLFNFLWDKEKIGIFSIRKRESLVNKDGIPEVMIFFPDRWQEKLHYITSDGQSYGTDSTKTRTI